jgi:uncharacterized protein YwgA
MAFENAQWLAWVVAAHPNREVVGRTRLQKTVWLLQRLGMPTDYTFSLHFYGPYSEELRADISLCEQFGVLEEQPKTAQDGTEYYIVSAPPANTKPQFEPFVEYVRMFAQQDAVVLELAATYDAFREQGLRHAEALRRLRAKKGSKCAEGREKTAVELVEHIGLSAS